MSVSIYKLRHLIPLNKASLHVHYVIWVCFHIGIILRVYIYEYVVSILRGAYIYVNNNFCECYSLLENKHEAWIIHVKPDECKRYEYVR